MKNPTDLVLAIITRGRVMMATDCPIPNIPAAIADITPACAELHAKSNRVIHFQLRDPANGRVVLAMEHGATTFNQLEGR